MKGINFFKKPSYKRGCLKARPPVVHNQPQTHLSTYIIQYLHSIQCHQSSCTLVLQPSPFKFWITKALENKRGSWCGGAVLVLLFVQYFPKKKKNDNACNF